MTADSRYTAPADWQEHQLAKLWSEILMVKKNIIGSDSNFFDLGGHSLKVIILVARIQKEFSTRIDMSKIFHNPTLKRMAAIIKSATKSKYTPIVPAEKKEYYILSSGQKRLFIQQQLNPDSTGYNMPQVVKLEGELGKNRLNEIIGKLIQRHESLRTSFFMMEELFVQRIHEYNQMEFEIQYHVLRPGQNDKPNIIDNFIRPFDLSQAPLIRVGLIKEEKGCYILMLDMHHIVNDGVSTVILIKDFIAHYTGKELSPLKLQYKDYSQWQNLLLQSRYLKKQETYWMKQFEGEIPVLNMLTDFPRPEEETFAGNSLNFTLGELLTRQLKQLVKARGLTLYIALLAVYYILLAKYTGQEDIVVGSGIAGRTHANLENIIGIFVNMLALRNRPGGDKTFEQFLEEIRESVFNAYENQDYQFDELVKKLGVQRQGNRNPLFDVQFTLQNVGLESIDPGGMQVKSYGYKKRVMQFDLSLDGAETGETITLRFAYLTSLFKPSTVEKMCVHFVEILEQVVENEYIKIKDINISHELSTGMQQDFTQNDYIDFEF
jgi:acyl carrier protein